MAAACAMAAGRMWHNNKDRRVECRAAAQEQQPKDEQKKVPKLVTFIGKGGAGKTTCSVMAAQFYASIGLRTCLVVQSQDITADFLLGHQLKYQPTTACGNELLTAFRLEITKILAQPLEQIKKADDRISFSQGAIQEVAGDELSVLPGMDSIMTLFVLEQLCGFARRAAPTQRSKTFKPKYDVVVYDGSNSDETLRMFGSAERARWYMNRFRSIAEKTDLGRVALPSIVKLSEATLIEDASSTPRPTSELWEMANTVLEAVEQNFANPETFSSYLVTDPSNRLAEKMALHYWGCAMQAGVHVAGVVQRGTSSSAARTSTQNFAPLGTASMPQLPFDETPPDWKQVVSSLDEETRRVLRGESRSAPPSPAVLFDPSARTVTCFLPGFEKPDVKLSQLKKSELLLSAGDQRRVIKLPPQMHGKVKGAKFQDRSLVIQLAS